MESLKSDKFNPISTEHLLQIRGGGKTNGGSYAITWESKEVNGRRLKRPYVKSYSGDNDDNKTMCYTDLEYCFGEWVEY